MSDEINHPAHYTAGSIEPIAAIEDWKLGFHLGNVVKYIARADHKGTRLKDLEKAAWYLAREIENTKGDQVSEPLLPQSLIEALRQPAKGSY